MGVRPLQIVQFTFFRRVLDCVLTEMATSDSNAKMLALSKKVLEYIDNMAIIGNPNALRSKSSPPSVKTSEKVCIVTGGSMGIGLACCKIYAEDGYQVYNVDVSDA